MAINWIDDAPAMAIADGMGIRHSLATIMISDIDKKKSAENRARDIPLDESRREGIRHSMDSGIPIPKIFVRAVGGEYVIAGGNHRFSGIDLRTKAIPVHVAFCTDAEFEIFCRALNTVVGVGMTHAERMKAAVDAVNRMGVSRKDAAAIYGVVQKSLEIAVRKAALEYRIESVLPGVRKKITASHLVCLGEMASNDNVLRAAADFVDKSKATVIEFSELAKEAKSKATEADAVAVFEVATMPYKKGKRASVPKRVRKSLLDVLTQIESLEGKTSWRQLELDPIEIAKVHARILKATSILDSLLRDSGSSSPTNGLQTTHHAQLQST